MKVSGSLSVGRDRSGVEVGETGEWMSGFAASLGKDGSMVGMLEIETRKERSEQLVTRTDQNEVKLRAYFWRVVVWRVGGEKVKTASRTRYEWLAVCHGY